MANPIPKKLDTREVFKCNECGEEWVHGGDAECPFCHSTDTGPKEDLSRDETGNVVQPQHQPEKE